MQKSKIAFFIIDYSLGGGVERVTSDLSHIFQRNDIEVSHLISFKRELETPRMDYPQNITIKTLSGNKKLLKNEIEEYLKKEKIERLIFQADNMTISLEILKATQNVGCKAFAHYHGSPFAYLRKYPDAQHANIHKILFSKLVFPFKKAKLKKFLSQSKDGVICVSNSVKQELMNLFPHQQFRLVAIRNPSNLGFTPVEKNRENMISLVSRLEQRHKNAFLSVKSWAIIAKKYPKWKLHLFGDGSLTEEMKKYAHHHRISESIVFHGFAKNVREQLQQGKISISTSNCEGFPMAVLEAIEAGNAIVATESDGGVADMVMDNLTGLTSPRNNEKALAKNMEQLIIDEDLRIKLAQAAQDNLKKIYEKPIIDLWKELLFGK